MRAVTYIGDATFRVEERDPRVPGRGEVRIDVAYVGICGHRRIRGNPKFGKTLLSPNQVIADIRSPSSVRTSIA
jgi:threonine dehydrogenase-like Zn-dependent dehydrogenase